MIRGDEQYVRFKGKLVDRSAKGVKVQTYLTTGWVARQCLAYVTDQTVAKAKIGADMEFQAMEWAAEKAGLI